MPPDVSVRDLVKHYVVPERAGGLRASLRSVVRRRHRLVRAVDGISFDVEPRRGRWLPRTQRRRQNHRAQGHERPAAPHRGAGGRAGFHPLGPPRRVPLADHPHHGPATAAVLGPPSRRLTQHPVYPDSSQRRVYPRPDAQWRVTPSPPGEAHGHKIAARPTHCEVMGRPRTQRCVPRLLAWTARRAPYRVFDSRSVGRSASPSSYG